MHINRQLNLVQEFKTDNGIIYLHSMPISVEVWRNYFEPLSATYAKIFARGLEYFAAVGPRIAHLELEKISRSIGVWEGESGVKFGLIPEIRRLSNVIIPTGTGWETMPYEHAIQRQLLDSEAAEEMEAVLIFFICLSAVLRGPSGRIQLDAYLEMLKRGWNAHITSLATMDFRASLPTLTPAETTGAKMPVSSVPH